MSSEHFSLDNFLIMDSNLEKSLDSRNIEFPFENRLSFEILIKHISEVAAGNDKIRSDFAKAIIAELDKAPELRGIIEDTSVLGKHETLVNNMMIFVFPTAFWEKQTFAASTPFMTDIFYASPKFRETIKFKDGIVQAELNIDMTSFSFGRTISAFALILDYFYGMNLNFDFPLVYKIVDDKSGLDRYFKLNLASEFMEIKVKGELKKLSKDELEKIRTNIYDLEYLRSQIDPANFLMTGFLVMNAINITDTEILSAIKKDLIEPNTITSNSGFTTLQQNLKSLLRCPGLMLGLADYPGSKERLFQHGRKIGNSFLMSEECIKHCRSMKGSLYDYAFETKKAVIMDDLSKYKQRTPVENELLNKGIRNILIAPLLYEDKITGILEIASPTPGKINMVNSMKLREILPLFALAVQKSREELENKVRIIIKEKCTAIHPTLEWKFVNAAHNLIKSENAGVKAEMEEISFNDVFSLYGLSDLRNSSVHRNDAIREDLIQNLENARSVLTEARNHKDLKILEALIYKTDKKIHSLGFGIDSGDESEVIGFLNKKIVPLFEHLKNYGKDVKQKIEEYNSYIDDNFGFIYNIRKKFDESTNHINTVLAAYLDEEQKKIQKIFPHYFERYKTDGVDHSIYIGQSLVENKRFSKIYLKNLRLWQLIIMCGLAVKSHELKKDLSYPLDTAHLILVQDSPISIRFRYDEKKFDVDGAYNVRYEIIKKRIDKAEIKGREERLTQPEKIALVFSQNSEMQEYFEYIEYLQMHKYLTGEVEELEIEELQGVKGLKAVRVGVNMSPSVNEKVDYDKIRTAVKEMVN